MSLRDLAQGFQNTLGSVGNSIGQGVQNVEHIFAPQQNPQMGPQQPQGNPLAPPMQNFMDWVGNNARNTQNYFNPTSNNGNNFWATQGAKNLAVAQPIVQPIIQPIENSIAKGAVGAGKLLAHSNTLNPIDPAMYKTPAVEYDPRTDASNAAQGIASAYGAVKAPIAAVVGGGISGALSAGENLLQGRPWEQDLPKAIGEGTNFAAQVSAPGEIAAKIPFLPKIAQGVSQNVEQNISKLGPGAAKIISNIAGNVASGVAKEAATGAGYGAIQGQNPIQSAADFAKYGLLHASANAFNPETINNTSVEDVIKRGQALGLKGINPAAFSIHPDDQDIMTKYIAAVRNPNGVGVGGAPSRQLSNDAQLLAEHYAPGYKFDSNQKIANVFDYLLDVNQGTTLPGQKIPAMGFASQKPQATEPSVISQLGERPVASTNPQADLANLMTYGNQLRSRGYSAKQINQISAPEAKGILENNIPPFQHATFEGSLADDAKTPTVAKDFATKKLNPVNSTDTIDSKPGGNPESAILELAQNQENNSKAPIYKKISNYFNPKNTKLPEVQQAIEARDTFGKQLDARASDLLPKVEQAVKINKNTFQPTKYIKTGDDLFRTAVEHPEQIENLSKQSANPEVFKKAVNAYQNYTDFVHPNIKANGRDIGYIKDYYQHRLAPEDQGKYNDLVNQKVKNYNGFFTNSRIVPTIEELKDLGINLKNEKVSQDIKEMNSNYKTNGGSNILFGKLAKALPGQITRASDEGGIPRDSFGQSFIQSKIPGMQDTVMSPALHAQIKHLEPGPLQDNQAAMWYDKINTLQKNVKLQGLFHALKESTIFFGNQVGSMRGIKDVANPLKILQGVRYFADEKGFNEYRENALKSGLLDAAAKVNISAGSTGDFGKQGESILTHNPLHKATFDRMIGYYQLETLKQALNHYKIDLNTPEGLLEGKKIGTQISNLFSGPNLDTIGRNKVNQFFLRSIFLAPAFNEGKVRGVLSLAKGGSEGDFARRAILGTVLTTALLTELGRRFATGKFDDIKGLVQNAIIDPNIPLGYQNKKGINQTAALPGSDFTDAFRFGTDPSHFMISRLASNPSTLYQQVVNKDYMSRPIYDPSSSTPEAIQRAEGAISGNIPSIIGDGAKVMQGQESPKNLPLTTLGIRVKNDPNDPTYKNQQAYFSVQNNVLKKLNANDTAAWNVIHPQKNDPNGNKIYQPGTWESQQKAIVYLNHPNVLAADMQIAQQVAKQTGQPGNPLANYSPSDQKVILTDQALPPGPEKSQFYKDHQSLLQDYYTKSAAYYASLPKSQQGAGQKQPPPSPSAYVQQQLNAKNYKDAQVQAFLKLSDDYKNQERAAMGLSPINQYGGLGPAKQYAKRKSSFMKRKLLGSANKGSGGKFKIKASNGGSYAKAFHKTSAFGKSSGAHTMTIAKIAPAKTAKFL